jgi:prepilin-type N-terminal cleavage/methylation domain-containing protein
MRRGFTLVEVLLGLSLASLMVLGSMALFAGSLRSLQRTDMDVTMTDQTSNALRKVTETLRQAVSVMITNNGRTINYRLPAYSNSVDPITGEKELIVPPVSDGVMRYYNIDFGSGTLRDQTGRVLVRNISGTDTDSGSTLYQSTYQPFSLVTIGTRKGLTMNLVTLNATGTPRRTVRMKTTTILQNVP